MCGSLTQSLRVSAAPILRSSRAASRVLLMILCGGAAGACALATPPPTPVHSSLEETPDSAWFAALAASVRETVSGEIRVDPRPLDDQTVSLAPEYVEVPARPEDARFRRGLLRRMNLGETDAIQDARCGGMHPPEIYSRRPQCPEQGRFYSVSIGKLTVSDTVPGEFRDGTGDGGPHIRYGSVPVTLRLMTPHGSTSTKFLFWLGRAQDGEWSVVGRKAIHFTD